MPNRQIINGEPYRYAYQGQEKDPETGKEAFQLRLWDARIGRWLTTDPAKQYASPYLGMGNNPMNGIDPDGAVYNPIYGSDGKFRGFDEFGIGGEAIVYDGDFTNGMAQSDILKGGGNLLSNWINTESFSNEAFMKIYISSNFHVSNDLDPSTIRKNIFGLSYPGGNNPKTYNGDADYTFTPDDFSEYPAIGHDRRYDRLGVAGASGLFTDTRAIGADYKFVAEELGIATNPFFSPKTRIYSGILGVGLGIAALPKTIYKFVSTPNNQAMSDVMIYYHISSHGVTNKPGK